MKMPEAVDPTIARKQIYEKYSGAKHTRAPEITIITIVTTNAILRPYLEDT